MRTDTVGKQEMWTRFMRLSQDARIRNQGLATGMTETGKTRNATVGATVTGLLETRAYAKTASTPSTYAVSRPAFTGRILGGKFDAYA